MMYLLYTDMRQLNKFGGCGGWGGGAVTYVFVALPDTQGPFSQFGKYAYLPITVGAPANGSYL